MKKIQKNQRNLSIEIKEIHRTQNILIDFHLTIVVLLIFEVIIVHLDCRAVLIYVN